MSATKVLRSLGKAALLGLAVGSCACSRTGAVSSEAGWGALLGGSFGTALGASVAKHSDLDSSIPVLAGLAGTAAGYFGGSALGSARKEEQLRALPPVRKAYVEEAFNEEQLRINALRQTIAESTKWHDEYPPDFSYSNTIDEEDAAPYQGQVR